MAGIPPLSNEQIALLARAKSQQIPVDEVIIRLYRIVSSGDEQLSPEWIDIWPKVQSGITIEGSNPRWLDAVNKAIKLLRHADAEIDNIVLKDINHICFLLGAGASAASNVPIISGLLPELWRKARSQTH